MVAETAEKAVEGGKSLLVGTKNFAVGTSKFALKAMPYVAVGAVGCYAAAPVAVSTALAQIAPATTAWGAVAFPPKAIGAMYANGAPIALAKTKAIAAGWSAPALAI